MNKKILIEATVKASNNKTHELSLCFEGEGIEATGYHVVYQNGKNDIDKPFGMDRVGAFREFHRILGNIVQYES